MSIDRPLEAMASVKSPCDEFACDKRRFCADDNLACAEFANWVQFDELLKPSAPHADAYAVAFAPDKDDPSTASSRANDAFALGILGRDDLTMAMHDFCSGGNAAD